MHRFAFQALFLCVFLLIGPSTVFGQSPEPLVETPSETPPLSEEELHAQLESAYGLLIDAELRKAELAVREILEKAPRSGMAYQILGRSLMGQDRLVDAIRALRMASDLEPGDVDHWRHLANALTHQRRFEDAVAAYEEGLEADPESADCHYYMVHLLFYELQRQKEGIEHWRQATELEPDNGLAFKYLGSGYAYIGHYQKAHKALLRAQELEPNDFQVTQMISWMEKNLDLNLPDPE